MQSIRDWLTNLSTVWQLLIIALASALIGGSAAFILNSGAPSKKPTAQQPKVAGVSITKYPKGDELGNQSSDDTDAGDASLFEDNSSSTTNTTPSPAPTPPPVATPPPATLRTIISHTTECMLDEGETYSVHNIAIWSDGIKDDLGSDVSLGSCEVTGN